MEKRKIIKFGSSSYVITLPTQWMKDNNLKKGDNLYLFNKGESLNISPKENRLEKTANIYLDNKILKLVNKEIISYYLKNYKYIKINGKNILEKLENIRILKDKLSSLEIVEILPETIILKDLSSISELKIKSIIQKIISMEKIIFNELIKDDKNKQDILIKALDKNINKLTFLGYKAINYNLDSWEDSNGLKNEICNWRIISTLENLGDNLKRISRLQRFTSNEQNLLLNTTIGNIKNYFIFLTDLLYSDANLNNNLEISLDKKNTLLREFEELRESCSENRKSFLVIIQLFKDTLGKLDDIVLSIIDFEK